MASQNLNLSNPLSRTSNLIGGAALLLIAVLAGVGYLGVLSTLITVGDAATTASVIADSLQQFRLGVACMALAAVLDIVVAAVLLALLTPVNATVAQAAAWFRVAYTAVFLVAITQLAIAPTLIDEPQALMNALDSYTIIWRTGLILFAVHLLLVGYLGFRSGFMPRVLALLIAIAGVGYLVDGFGTILVANYTPTISSLTFVGEVALIGWLFWSARAVRRLAPAMA